VVNFMDMSQNHPGYKLLAYFAHPDDETMFLGGTLACLADRGVELHYLCATRGEGGERGDPPMCLPDELGFLREKELHCAVDALGGKTLNFLNYQDPPVGPEGELYPFTDDVSGLAEVLRNEIQKLKPDIIISHGPAGEYGHPAHIQAYQGLSLALGTINEKPAIYAPAWLSRETGEFTPQPGMLLDISEWRELKVAAALCHRTQHDLFIRHGSARAGKPVTVPEMIRSQEALYKINLGNNSSQEDLLADLLQDIIISNEN
jgi:LmbE family N-acetylglucosaminyl deacetylase